MTRFIRGESPFIIAQMVTGLAGAGAFCVTSVRICIGDKRQLLQGARCRQIPLVTDVGRPGSGSVTKARLVEFGAAETK